MILIWLLILGFVSGYREVQILIERGSWYYVYTWIPFWDGVWNLDSFHFMGGLRHLISIVGIWFILRGWIDYKIISLDFLGDYEAIPLIIIYWLYFYWMRNIAMHIVYMKKEHRRWKYLFPLYND